MTKEENRALANEIRMAIKKLRIEGYGYKLFYSAINYSPTNGYNFMRHYSMSDDNLITLKELLENEYNIEIERW